MEPLTQAITWDQNDLKYAQEPIDKIENRIDDYIQKELTVKEKRLLSQNHIET